MDGNTLYPLRQLQKRNPGAYAVHMRKYRGKEYLLKEAIRQLKCLWDDVLHFTAVHPEDINKALAKTNCPTIDSGFYKIKPKLLDTSKVIVYLYMVNEYNKCIYQEFRPFDPKKLKEYTEVPEQTIEYYKREKLANREPLTFHGIPHILFKGSINIEGVPIIK